VTRRPVFRVIDGADRGRTPFLDWFRPWNATVLPHVRDQRGSISVVTGGVIAIMVFLTLGVADVGAALIARERVRAAADAAALAAAQELAMPSASLPQDQAAEYAERNGASLLACTCARGSQEAIVRVRVPIDHLFLFPGAHAVEAQARAVVDLP
jgi:secretion/DNA translocation related TadE-like protein